MAARCTNIPVDFIHPEEKTKNVVTYQHRSDRFIKWTCSTHLVQLKWTPFEAESELSAICRPADGSTALDRRRLLRLVPHHRLVLSTDVPGETLRVYCGCPQPKYRLNYF